jgi:uncharacterized LabA/DUF88 family protein
MEGKACVFVDGENLRHSLIDLFQKEPLFRPAEYVPVSARWSDFFDWIVSTATTDTCRRLRTYWFSIETIDCFPYGLSQFSNPEKNPSLKRALSRHRQYQEKLRGRTADDVAVEMRQIVTQLRESQQRVEARFGRWTAIQNRIALEQRAIEFRRAGAISLNLYDGRFGQEKAVDVRLACDMIILRDIYDAAIIVSGDQDYVPAAQILKDSGKTVINVAFQRRNGKLLPGGARRLNIVTDASISVPYEVLRSYMGLDAANTPVGTTQDQAA